MPGRLKDNPQIVLLAHNLRSTHNVGSLFRTAEGLGVSELVLTGYTPYPKEVNDDRLAYISDKLDKQIAKTALGAEKLLKWSHVEDIKQVISKCKDQGYVVYGLEQTKSSIDIFSVEPESKIVLIVGNEVNGLETEVLQVCDKVLEIPMLGKKESFNVVQAAAMAMFYLTYNLK